MKQFLTDHGQIIIVVLAVIIFILLYDILWKLRSRMKKQHNEITINDLKLMGIENDYKSLTDYEIYLQNPAKKPWSYFKEGYSYIIKKPLLYNKGEKIGDEYELHYFRVKKIFKNGVAEIIEIDKYNTKRKETFLAQTKHKFFTINADEYIIISKPPKE